MKTSSSSHYIKYAAFAAVLLASAGCSDDSAKGVALNCETGLVVCGNQCCDGTCENGVCKPNGSSGEKDVCPKGLSECRGACVDYKASHNNCGSCGNACDDNEVCVEGDCKPNACPTGMEICNGACINKKIDAENCGACGNVCGGNAYCADSACQCPQGYSDCDHNMANGCEAATLKCDSLCDDASQVKCDGGACCDNASECCGSACCGEGTTCCGDGICADVQSDAANCGTCGNACTDGKSCVDGNCERVCSGATPDKCEALDVCVNFASDVLHCGNCDTKCATTETCVEGVCTPSEVNCSDDPDADATTLCWGTCVDLDSDAQNCGTCGNACLADQACEAGTCVCPPDTQVCEGKCVDYASDRNHCGSCGNACLADQTCEESTCVCPEGTGVCGDKCLDFSSDKNNCGSCGHACVGDEICEAGACKLVCANANDIVCNGTCVDPQTSNTYCGNCDTKCATTETCVEGVCTPSEVDCSADGDDPDATPKTLCWGVCTDLSSDKANCGACGEACVEGQNCVEGACVCPAETTLCNGKCISFTSDAANCGACGRACGDKQICASGECVASEVITCFGKETDLKSDVNNCGACLHKCSTGEACEDGVCTLVCGEGYTLCNGACINLSSSAANCGACGHACKDGESCDASLCNCSAGRFDCDGDASNGCESTSKCACEPGSKQACWRGAAENRHVGACKEDGEQICDATGQFWGPCIGGIYPSAITCDDAGIYYGGDQNCNGKPDEEEECVSSCDLRLTDSSYIGCEYWPVFLQNYGGHFSDFEVSMLGYDMYYDMTLIISNPNKTTTTVYVFDKSKYENVSHVPYLQFDIPAGSVVTKTIVGDPNGTQYNKAIGSSSQTIFSYMLKNTMLAPYAFKVRSSLPVVVYQFNPYGKSNGYTADASLLLPSNVLGQEYIDLTYYSGSSDINANTLAIVAVKPGVTNVDVFPTINIASGIKVEDSSTLKAVSAGMKESYKLKQFDVLNLQQSVDGEMTGSKIQADKPIAVFGGAACTNIRSACDHTEEQLFPTNVWGSNYYAIRAGYDHVNKKILGTELNDYYILAQQNGTNVTINGNQNTSTTDTIVLPAYTGGSGSKNAIVISTNNSFTGSVTLNEGQFTKISTIKNFQVSANKPILVGQFIDDVKSIGDPGFTLNVPVEQYRRDYAFSIPSNYEYDFVTLVAPKNSKIRYTGDGYKNVKYNDVLVDDLPSNVFSGWMSVGNDNYVYGYLDLDAGTHQLVGDQKFGALGYGFGDANSSTDDTSYAYPIGLNLDRINNTN